MKETNYPSTIVVNNASITTEATANKSVFLVFGIVMLVLGIAAVAFPFIASLAVELFIGWIFIISGVAGFVNALRAARWKGFIFTLMSALISLAIGALLLFFPLPGILSLTLVVTAFLIATGIIKVFLAFRLRPLDHWIWYLASGILSLILAGLILSQWPHAATWVIGLLIGIDMIFFGVAFIILASAARRLL